MKNGQEGLNTAPFKPGDHVSVLQVVHHYDHVDTEDHEGWVVFCGEAVLVIADTPGWLNMYTEDYSTETYDLDKVIVSPINEAPQ